jgi:hypothetical protein
MSQQAEHHSPILPAHRSSYTMRHAARCTAETMLSIVSAVSMAMAQRKGISFYMAG